MTIFLIALTVLVSILAFNRRDIFDKLKFNAYYIHKDKNWYRFVSYGLIHADWTHLLINMFVLYSFGEIVEQLFFYYFEFKGYVFFLLLYIGGIGFSTLFDYGKYKNDIYYNAVGASGAVSAVVFASILLYPAGKIFLFLIPIGIPAPIFGILYLVYSAYSAKKGTGNIGHSAHFWGAIFGIVFTVAINPSFFLLFVDYLAGIFS
ncbi:MAG: rhomboid family intramembrane serine protease [Bacteroidales bacterium]|nr:rhomboid family intramembrane serine protease [Bacteroidales bacterium]